MLSDGNSEEVDFLVLSPSHSAEPQEDEEVSDEEDDNEVPILFLPNFVASPSETHVPSATEKQTEKLGRVSPVDEVGSIEELRPKAGRKLQRRVRKPAKRKDLFTFSPYIRSKRILGRVKTGCAVYLWTSWIVSVVIWGEADRQIGGTYPCQASTNTNAEFASHPTFWNLLMCSFKLTCEAAVCQWPQNHRLKRWIIFFEHFAVPGLLTYTIYFGGASKEIKSEQSIGLAFNNHLGVPLVMLATMWVGKTPFMLERVWEIFVYMLWQILFVFVYSFVTEGCYLIPALNPDRNIVWISYPGLALLYLLGFLLVYVFTQMRDHVALCGQEVIPPAWHNLVPR